MQTCMVELGARSYPVTIITDDNASPLEAMQELTHGSRIHLVTNTTLSSLYDQELAAWETALGTERIILPDGEEYKTVQTWHDLLDRLLRRRIERRDLLCAFGGGVVGDITGFAAAACLRGVGLVQVPTTLLAMVDSSVGGKTGVNHACGKNLIGAFYQPRLVWIAPRYLRTLPQREYLAGYAEMFKYAFIGGQDMFRFIQAHHAALQKGEEQVCAQGIYRSVVIKAGVVARDEQEGDCRALLNFGHTFGHALETWSGYHGILHGEAVAFGMVCACECGRRCNMIPPGERDTFAALERHIPLPTLSRLPQPDELYRHMFSDKKVRGGRIRFVLPTTPGSAVITQAPTEADVLASIACGLEQCRG